MSMEPRPTEEPSEPQGPRLPPVAYPLLGLVFGGILVWSLSRVLLAVKKDYAPAIALLVSLNVLVGAALVAYGSRVRRRPASFPLLLGAGACVVAIGLVALNLKPAEIANAGGESQAVQVQLAAKNTAFDKTQLQFPAGAKVAMAFDNEDAGVPHNFALFADQAATQVLFTGDLVTGPKTTTYDFTAPDTPGTYYFHCDVHPTQMKGTVTVGPPGAPAGEGTGGGGGPGGTTVVAKGLAFQPTEVSVPGGGQVTIHFDNQDSGIPHNMVVFDGSDATGTPLFTGDLVTGPATKDYTFPAPPPGSYFFHCEVHPTQMKGTLVVK